MQNKSQEVSWSRAIGSSLLAILFVCSVSAGGGGDITDRTDLPQRMIWSSIEKQRPLFIPQDLLASLSLEKLPLSEREKKDLELRLEYQRHPELYPKQIPSGRLAECRERASSGGQGSAPQAKDFAELLGDTEVAFVGTIERVEAGLDPRLIEAVEMAFVRVDKVVHRQKGVEAAQEESTVAILSPGGRITIEGTVLCDDRREGFYHPRPGDRILAAGWIGEEDERFIDGAYVFPLDGEEIHVQPYAFLRKDAESGVLQTLPSRLEEVREEKEGSR